MSRRLLLPGGATLIKLNIAACVLHTVSFIASVVISTIYRNGSYVASITTDFSDKIARYQLIWVDLPFPAITAFFHGAIAFVPYFQKIYLTPDNGSPLRWIEYSITASLMTWAILQLASVTNVFLLILAGPVMNMALQAQGYLQERFPATRIPTLVGWLLFSGQWILIWTYYGFRDTRPWFVHSIVIGCFIWFSLFGAIQLLVKTRYNQERLYIALSFTSKLYLTWNLLVAAATSS